MRINPNQKTKGEITMKAEKREFILFIDGSYSREIGRYNYQNNDPGYTITARILTVEDESPRNPSGTIFDSIRIEWREYFYNKETKSSSLWRVYFDGGRYSDLENVESAAKGLRKISNGLERFQREEGEALDFAQVLLRVSKALGIKRWAWTVGDSTGWYSKDDHRFAGVVEGMYHVRRLPIENKGWQSVVEEKREQQKEKEALQSAEA